VRRTAPRRSILRRSERLFEHLDGWSPGPHRHAGHIEADRARMRTRRLQERFGEGAELRALAPRDGFEPTAEGALPSCLHLAEDEHAPTLHDEIELAEPAAPVPRHDAVAATTVDISRGILSACADRSRRHGTDASR